MPTGAKRKMKKRKLNLDKLNLIEAARGLMMIRQYGGGIAMINVGLDRLFQAVLDLPKAPLIVPAALVRAVAYMLESESHDDIQEAHELYEILAKAGLRDLDGSEDPE